jgi:hypothetical protein
VADAADGAGSDPGAFIFSLNLGASSGSAGAAVSAAGGGISGAAAAGAAGGIIVAGAGVSGSVAAAGGSTAILGFRRTRSGGGGGTGSAAGDGMTGAGAGGGDDEDVAALGGSAVSFGFNRNLGSAFSSGAAVGSAAAGAVSSGRLRGFSRNGGGGVSSLMRPQENNFYRNTKPKRFTRGHPPSAYVIPTLAMKRLCLLCLAALVLTSASGCHFFRKKHPKVKETSIIGTDTEMEFKRRWTERRVSELTARGTTAERARQQAEEEFQTRFSYTNAAHR